MMSETKCPVMNGAHRHTAAGVLSNSDWWPNQLNLQICPPRWRGPILPDGRHGQLPHVQQWLLVPDAAEPLERETGSGKSKGSGVNYGIDARPEGISHEFGYFDRSDRGTLTLTDGFLSGPPLLSPLPDLRHM